MSAKNGTGVLHCQYYSWMRQSQVCLNTFCSGIIRGHTNSIETWKRTKCVYIVCTAWLYHSMNDIGCQLKKAFLLRALWWTNTVTVFFHHQLLAILIMRLCFY